MISVVTCPRIAIVVGALAAVVAVTAACTEEPPARARRGPSANAEPSARDLARTFVPSATGAAIDRDFPDPTVVRASDGSFYAYATQSVVGSKAVNVQVARSEDLERWTYLGDALPEEPAWASTTQAFWAPDVVERGGTFYLYYSAIPDDASGEEFCLAVATSETPEGPFRDSGGPLLCGIEIDPKVFRDPRSGDWLLYWGSSGDIVVQPLADDMVQLEGTAPTMVLQGWSSPVRRPFERGIEGPFVTFRDGWYYLFYSGDRCCEFPPHYAVLVARSRRAEGGFRRFDSRIPGRGSAILRDRGRWLGPGHCSVVRDAAGRDWIAYHAIDRRQPRLSNGDVRRVMHLDRLTYRRGWPAVAGARS